MLAGDLLLVRVDERAAADDVPPAHEQTVDTVRPAQDEVRDEIAGAAELEAVGSPDREIGAPARREAADVVAPQNLGAAAGAEPQRLPRGHRLAAVAAARDQ